MRICITGGAPFIVPASRVPGGSGGLAVQTLDQVREEEPLAANVVYDPHDPSFPLGGLDVEYWCVPSTRTRADTARQPLCSRRGAPRPSERGT